MKIFRLHPSGQIIIFLQPRFPWNCRGFPLLNHHSGGIGTRVRSRWNLTRSFENCSLPTAAQQLHNIHNGVLAERNCQVSINCQVSAKWSDSDPTVGTVDKRNPAPVDMVNIPLFIGFHTSQVVQDFSHQQYGSSSLQLHFFGKYEKKRGSVHAWMNCPWIFHPLGITSYYKSGHEPHQEIVVKSPKKQLLTVAFSKEKDISSWWFQPIWKISVKLGIFPK